MYVVNFEHHAVDEIIEFFTFFTRTVGIFHSRFRIVDFFKVTFGFKTFGFQKFTHFGLRGKSFIAITDIVCKKGQASLCGDLRIEIANCACRTVSCVFERLACGKIVFVEP